MPSPTPAARRPVYGRRERAVAVAYGAACHLAFAAAIAAMIYSLCFGMQAGRGALQGRAAWAANVALVLQFALGHSFLLSERGRRLLRRGAPFGLGRDLETTSYACIVSLQLLLTFAAWSPVGPVWWEAHGAARWLLNAVYSGAWLLLLKSMHDSGLEVQSGFLGWSAVARGRAPRYGPFRERGTFRYVRQPIYVAFSLALWTGPVWTPDHLLVACGWTAYCLAGPLLKERRYLRIHGEAFQRYRARVPYWLPALRRLEPAALRGVGTGPDGPRGPW